MCFVHAILPSDFFVYLVEFLLASSGYGRYQSQIEVPAQGGLHAFGIPTADVTTVAAAFASTERLPGPPDFPGNSGSRPTPGPRCRPRASPSPRDVDDPEVAKAAASRYRSRSPANRVAAERRWLRPPNSPTAQVSTEPAVALAAPPRTLFFDAKSCGPAISGSFKTTESCRIHLKNVLLSRASLLGSPEPACSPAGLMV